MGETFEEKLRGVSLLDIYDDIAPITIPTEHLIQSCIDIPCRVDLKTGNLVYSVEQKYKQKLSKYRDSQRLKWLQLNFKAIIPDPEAKLLKWNRQHRINKRHEWMQRKLHVLDTFSNETEIVQSEEPCCSHSLKLIAERRMSLRSQKSLRRSSYRDVDTSCSTVGNASMQTVIQSQPKSSEDMTIGDNSPLIHFKNVSRSSFSSSSGELPSLCAEGEVVLQETEIPTRPQYVSPSRNKHIEREPVRCAKPLLFDSEGPLSEDAYATFYQDMQVTSTQEFG